LWFPAIVTSVGSVVQGKIAHRQRKPRSTPPGREFRLKQELARIIHQPKNRSEKISLELS